MSEASTHTGFPGIRSAAVADMTTGSGTILHTSADRYSRGTFSSMLAAARIIEDTDRIQYPEGVKRPKPELNVNARPSSYRYDRDFLLQFMAVCKDKPDSLPALDILGLIGREDMPRALHGRRSSSTSMPAPSCYVPVGLGILGSHETPIKSFTMGQFSLPTPISSGETQKDQRQHTRSTSMSNIPTRLPITRLRSVPPVKKSNRGVPSPGGQTSMHSSVATEPEPHPTSARPIPAISTTKDVSAEKNLGDATVRILLNELTMEHFDSISDRIVAWTNRSMQEKDGETLQKVVDLVYERAIGGWTSPATYARLCRKAMEQISPDNCDEGSRDARGMHIGGGQLFRRYLLSRCREDFERAWGSQEAVVSNEIAEAREGEATNGSETGKDSPSDKGHTAQEVERHNINVVAFMGELFKLQMLTDLVVHNSIEALFRKMECPGAIVGLCTLLTNVGCIIDTPKARAHMHVYFSRLEELAQSSSLDRSTRAMVRGVISLRERGWVGRG